MKTIERTSRFHSSLHRKQRRNRNVKIKRRTRSIKKEVKAVSEKVRELTPEELAQVTGGVEIKHPVLDCVTAFDFAFAGIESGPEGYNR